MTFYTEKLILSGSVYEHYIFQKPIRKGFCKDPPRGSPIQKENQEENQDRERALRRARQQVRRSINSNVWQYYDARGRPYMPKFLTLTFKENVTDLDQTNYEWKKFRQRLEYQVKEKLKYLTVIEFQKRGAVHYHSMLFNMPYIKQKVIRDAWGHGFIYINAIEQIDNLGAYVSKYLRKELAD